MSDKQQPKPKQYSIDPETISEMSFISMENRAAEEVFAYWNRRLQGKMDAIRKKLSIPPHFDVDWNQLFSKQIILVTSKPEPKVVPAEEVIGRREDVEKEEHGTEQPATAK